MEDDRAYRDEGLSVESLADRFGVPEFRLRRLINQRLGHRNFTDFVDLYRLEEAERALSDPAQARAPVLTIARDAGWCPSALSNELSRPIPAGSYRVSAPGIGRF